MAREIGLQRQNNTILFHILYSIIYKEYHRISVMGLGHLLTRSGLTYPEISSKVCHDSFCQSGSSVSLPWGIYYAIYKEYNICIVYTVCIINGNNSFCPLFYLIFVSLDSINVLNSNILYEPSWSIRPSFSVRILKF